jgi:hypothetical protein
VVRLTSDRARRNRKSRSPDEAPAKSGIDRKAFNADPGFHFVPSGLRKMKDTERRQTRILKPPRPHLHPPARGAQRRGRGARPAGRAACRRSTTALAAASQRRSSAPDALPGDVVGAHDPDGSKDRALLNGRYPLLPVPVQRSSSQTGHSAGRALSRSRPGVTVTSRHPREPHPLHRPVSPADVLPKRDLIRFICNRK